MTTETRREAMHRVRGEIWRDAQERERWAGNDHRWGKPSTTFLGFLVLAIFDRLFHPNEAKRIARHRRLSIRRA